MPEIIGIDERNGDGNNSATKEHTAIFSDEVRNDNEQGED